MMHLARGHVPTGERGRERQFWTGLARAFGGAIFFSLPLLMTMEMWWFGSTMSRGPLVLLMVLMIPVLVGLSHYSGFKETATWRDDVVDAFVAYGVGFASSAVILLLLNVIQLTTPLRDLVGKVALQSIPASFGAVLASSQLGGGGESERRRKANVHYFGELFLMAAGAIFLAFNLAPTDEMPLLAYTMTSWHSLALVLASLAMMHGFVYSVEFHGTAARPEGVSLTSLFARYTIPGYAIALLVSAYVLWTFGRYDGLAIGSGSMVTQAVALALPASLGAAAARLIL